MKKKLESELISIAHRILKLKNKSELAQLHAETRNLYEKLSVLKFVDENFAEVKPTIGKQEVEEKLEAHFADEPVTIKEETVAPEIVESEEVQPEEIKPDVIKPEPETDPEPEKEDVPANEPATEIQPEVENPPQQQPPAPEEDPAPEEVPLPEETPQEEPIDEQPAEVSPVPDSFKPAFEWAFTAKDERQDADDNQKTTDKKPEGQIAFDDLLGSSYVDPIFVKPEELEHERRNIAVKLDLSQAKAPERTQSNEAIAQKTVSLNDRLSKGITVGLNDRIAFVKHLFNNSSEDYNRVLSQLITFDTFEEAQEFIDQMVKPDYNNWHGKDEYATRFMEVVEKKFS